MKPIFLTLSLLTLAACSSTKPAELAPKPVAATPPGQFSIPVDSPKLAQIRTEVVRNLPVNAGACEVRLDPMTGHTVLKFQAGARVSRDEPKRVSGPSEAA